jgi:chromosomal replication initiator protein
MSALITNIWREASETLRRTLGEKVYRLWFERSRLQSIERGTALVGVPNAFAKEWLETHYRERVAAALGAALRSAVSVEFRVDGALYRAAREAEARELREGEGQRPARDPEERFALDRFVADDGSRMALHAILQIVESPGQRWNPFLVYGPPGCGKTHLLRGAASALCRRLSGPPRLTDGLSLRADVLRALRRREVAAMQARYLASPALLVDEVHRIGTTPATLRATGTLVKALLEAGRPVLLASRHQPADIRSLDATLRSLLLGGLTVELPSPRRETLRAILSRESLEYARPIELAAVDVLLDRLPPDASQLFSVLRRLVAYAALCGEEPAAAFFREHLPELLRPAPVGEVIGGVLSEVSRRFDAREDEMLGRKKSRRLARPRAVALYVLHRTAGQSLAALGELFGGRSVASLRAIVRRISREMAGDEELRECVTQICRRTRTESAPP